MVSPPEKMYRQNYAERRNVEAKFRQSRRLEKQVDDERNRNEKCNAANTIMKCIAILEQRFLIS